MVSIQIEGMKSHCQFIENSHRNKFKYRLESLFSRNLFPTFKYTKLAAVKRGHTFTLKCTLKAIYNLNPRKPRPSPQTIHHNGGHSHFSQVTAHPQNGCHFVLYYSRYGSEALNWGHKLGTTQIFVGIKNAFGIFDFILNSSALSVCFIDNVSLSLFFVPLDAKSDSRELGKRKVFPQKNVFLCICNAICVIWTQHLPKHKGRPVFASFTTDTCIRTFSVHEFSV